MAATRSTYIAPARREHAARCLHAWVGWIKRRATVRRLRRREAVEAELDRTQADLRRTILALAVELGGDALEARKALIRASFLASGRVPED